MSTAIITADLADRLTKLCGMFGSDFDGERANAARMADELVRNAGLAWPDVIMPGTNTPSVNGRVWREPTTIRETVMVCLLFTEPLTDWEISFLRSIASRTRLSPKQQNVLNRILGKSRDFARMVAAA